MEMHSVANLGTLQTPLATFFPSKKRPNLVSENHRYCRASARSCSPSARAHTSLSLSLSLSASALFNAHTSLSLSLCVCSVQRAHTSLSLSASALFSAHTSLSLCVCSVQRAHTSLSFSLSLSLSLSLRLLSTRQREGQRFNSVKHRYYVASLILHASIAEITAQLLSLSYVYLISSDDGAIIRTFLCRLTSWKGELVMYSSLNRSRFSHYFIFIPLSDNRNSKIYQWKQFYWEYSFIKIQYVGTERQTNVIINNKCTFCIFRRRAALCAKM